jgi:hypothetical protein
VTIRHIVLIRFTEQTTDEQVDHLASGLNALPEAIPEIRAYWHGRDAGIRDSSWDYAITGNFDSPEDFRTYVDHPAHKALVTERLEPISEQRASVQFVGN